jgi:hypothetical protein
VVSGSRPFKTATSGLKIGIPNRTISSKRALMHTSLFNAIDQSCQPWASAGHLAYAKPAVGLSNEMILLGPTRPDATGWRREFAMAD